MARLGRMLTLGLRYLVCGSWWHDARAVRLYRWLEPVDVLLFCTSPVDEQWLRTTFRECRRRGMRCASALVAMGGPPLAEPERFDVRVSPLGLRRLAARVVVTSSSGVPRWVMPRSARHCVHMPHSLVSLHMVYPDGAFDGYDAFFCCGEHHVREVARLDELAGRPPRACYRVGYGKMDLMRRRRAEPDAAGAGGKTDRPTVLLAPSWGPGSILETIGEPLVAALLDAQFGVVVRPHPLVVAERGDLLEAIARRAAAGDALAIESPSDEPRAMHSAAVMISDYSGAAFEYAFLRERPVVFVDVPLKEVNPAWRRLGLEPMEVALRRRVGTVVAPKVDAVVDAVRRLLAEGDARAEAIRDVRSEAVFNWDDCAGAAADAIGRLLGSA